MRCNCETCAKLPEHPTIPNHHLNPETGILPLHEWGAECYRGFVRNERFGAGQTVIAGTNRQKTKKAYSKFGGASGELKTP